MDKGVDKKEVTIRGEFLQIGNNVLVNLRNIISVEWPTISGYKDGDIYGVKIYCTHKHLVDLFKDVQLWPPGQMRADGNWLCSQLVQSLDEAGKAIRENRRLRKEVEALRKKKEG